MAKLARNRCMYFGCWNPSAIAASFSFNIGDSSGITAADLVASTGQATFIAKVSGSGQYTFLCTAATPVWELDGVEVTLSEYGISATGTPAKGDIIVVDYVAAASGGWEAIGKDNDDLSKELNPDTESSKNVLGEVTFTHSGYETEVGVDPYYIDPSRKMYKKIRDNAIEENYSESDLSGYFAEAYFETANKITGKMTGIAYVRKAWYVPQSTGGDTSGFAVPVNIYPVGGMEKKKIVYDMATNEATMSALS